MVTRSPNSSPRSWCLRGEIKLRVPHAHLQSGERSGSKPSGRRPLAQRLKMEKTQAAPGMPAYACSTAEMQRCRRPWLSRRAFRGRLRAWSPVRVLPCCLTVMSAPKVLSSAVTMFAVGLRLPVGLPDFPFWNCVCFGGFLYPTS